ncbi:hypothetical protein HDU84_005720 [Entophlyctis sp. JEL0112]|nr:hypothetical protein HDU84_005720 [Entophlyctis sp. JEL0112]
MSDATQTIFRTLCPFTVFSNAAIILCVRSIPRLQTTVNNFQEFLAISDIVCNIVLMIGNDLSRSNPSACYAIGAVMHFFILSLPLWSFLISFYIHLTVVYSELAVKSKMIWFCLYGWGLPVVGLVGTFIAQQASKKGDIFGDAIFECWISSAYNDLRLESFYIPLWIHLILTVVTYLLTFAHVRNAVEELSKVSVMSLRKSGMCLSGDATADNSVRNSKRKLLLKSGILCGGYLISWAPATALRAFEALGATPPTWLLLWSSVMLSVSGCWNAAAFFVVAFWPDHVP